MGVKEVIIYRDWNRIRGCQDKVLRETGLTVKQNERTFYGGGNILYLSWGSSTWVCMYVFIYFIVKSH